MTSLFLSYSREDDERFVRRLHDDLTARGFDVWWDRVSMPSRALTFLHEIREAITTCDRLVLVVGPGAVRSDYVAAEWRYAVETGKAVNPVLRLGGYELLPPELGLLDAPDFRTDVNYATCLETLVRQLSERVAAMGKLIAVPSLPPHFLKRPDRLRALKDAVLIDLQRPVVVTGTISRAGIHGMGGIGKSVLAAALARDHDVRRAFPDGVIWIPFGQEPELSALQRELAKVFEDPGDFEHVAEGRQRLRELLEPRAALLILDDVWNPAHVDAFDALGPRCRMLMTTRDASLITTLGGTHHQVHLLSEVEALALLARWADCDADRLPQAARQVMDECGRLPLALSLCGAMVRGGTSWADVLDALRQADHQFVSHALAGYPHKDVFKAIKVSLDACEPSARARFAELAVFPGDEAVPESAVTTLWTHTSGMADRAARHLLTVLAGKSLVKIETDTTRPGEPGRRLVSLHDLLYDYAVREAGDMRALHEALLAAYGKRCPAGWASGPDDGYYFQHLRQHLVTVTRWDDLEGLLTDLHYIEARCARGDTFELIADYAALLSALPEGAGEHERVRGLDERLARYTRELVTWASGLSPAPEPAPSVRPWTADEIHAHTARVGAAPSRVDRLVAFSQFLGHESSVLLRFGAHPGFCCQQACNASEGGLVSQAARRLVNRTQGPILWLRPSSQQSVWNPHPARLRTLDHVALVVNVGMTPDGRRAVSSGFWDTSLRVWDLESGECVRTIVSNAESSHVAVSADGRTAAGCTNDLLSLWDLESGTCLASTKTDGPGGPVAITADGRRVLWQSGTLRVWDIGTQGPARSVAERVRAAAMTGDGRRAIVIGQDGPLTEWDLDSGTCLRAFDVGGDVSGVTITPNGHRAITFGNHTLRVWDMASGRCVRTLDAPTDTYLIGTMVFEVDEPISAVSVTCDGRIALSARRGHHETLRIWDLESGDCLRTLKGPANAVVMTADGRRAVSGGDRELHVWDLEAGHSFEVAGGKRTRFFGEGVTMMPDGRTAVSTGESSALAMWDVESGRHLRALGVGTGAVQALAITSDGERACGISENALHVWDLKSGGRIDEPGHTGTIETLALTADGCCVLTGSLDRTVRLWDAESARCIRVFEGHVGGVMAVVLTPDGLYAASGDWDGMLCVWNLDSGLLLRVLEGFRHEQQARSLAMMPDGRSLLCGSDENVVRRWDISTGQCRQTLEGHTDLVLCATVTPDGRYAVSGGADRTLRLWDLATGRCVRVFEGHTGWINDVKVTADGRRAISRSSIERGFGGPDRSLRLWELSTGECLAVFASEAPVTDMGASPASVVFRSHSEALGVLHPSQPLMTAVPVVTATRLWHHGLSGEAGYWDNDLTVACAWCGRRSPVGMPDPIGTVDLRCAAAGCGGMLRLNAFVCDPTSAPA